MAHGYDIVYHLFVLLMMDLIRAKGVERPFDTSRKIMGPIGIFPEKNQTAFHVQTQMWSVTWLKRTIMSDPAWC